MSRHAPRRADRRVLRIIKCLRLLQDACYSPEDLAQHFRVSKRTVYRDLRVLARAGVPLVRPTGRQCYQVMVGASARLARSSG